MALGKSVFLVGPGFIGWNVLDLLVAEGYKVTALTRRPEHAARLEASGAQTVSGSLDDHDLIANQTVKSDIVLHIATADHLPSAQAILDGVSRRTAAGNDTIYIHTSGTSVLDDSARGAFASPQIYTDASASAIDALPANAPHRQIDLAIVAAQRRLAPRARIAIMLPPLIYGYNPAHGRLSIQIPTLARFALKHGYAGHVGAGLSVESNVHVLDLARAYMVLLHWIESSPSAAADLVQNPYFYCEGGNEASWRDVAEHIGAELHAAGRLVDPTPRTIPPAEYGDLFGSDLTDGIVGLNSRSRAVRLRDMGWEAREKGVWESLREDEMPAILRDEHVPFDGYKFSLG